MTSLIQFRLLWMDVISAANFNGMPDTTYAINRNKRIFIHFYSTILDQWETIFFSTYCAYRSDQNCCQKEFHIELFCVFGLLGRNWLKFVDFISIYIQSSDNTLILLSKTFPMNPILSFDCVVCSPEIVQSIRRNHHSTFHFRRNFRLIFIWSS